MALSMSSARATARASRGLAALVALALLANACTWLTRRTFRPTGPTPDDHGVTVRVVLFSFARGSDADPETSSYRFFLSADALLAKATSTATAPPRSARVTAVRLFRVQDGQKTEIALPPLERFARSALETSRGLLLPPACLDLLAVITVLVAQDGGEVSRTFEVPLHRRDESRLGGPGMR
jgi:hypothetical protein